MSRAIAIVTIATVAIYLSGCNRSPGTGARERTVPTPDQIADAKAKIQERLDDPMYVAEAEADVVRRHRAAVALLATQPFPDNALPFLLYASLYQARPHDKMYHLIVGWLGGDIAKLIISDGNAKVIAIVDQGFESSADFKADEVCLLRADGALVSARSEAQDAAMNLPIERADVRLRLSLKAINSPLWVQLVDNNGVPSQRVLLHVGKITPTRQIANRELGELIEEPKVAELDIGDRAALVHALEAVRQELQADATENLERPFPILAVVRRLTESEVKCQLDLSWLELGFSAEGVYLESPDGVRTEYRGSRWLELEKHQFHNTQRLLRHKTLICTIATGAIATEESSLSREGFGLVSLVAPATFGIDEGWRVGLLSKDGRRSGAIECTCIGQPIVPHSTSEP